MHVIHSSWSKNVFLYILAYTNLLSFNKKLTTTSLERSIKWSVLQKEYVWGKNIKCSEIKTTNVNGISFSLLFLNCIYKFVTKLYESLKSSQTVLYSWYYQKIITTYKVEYGIYLFWYTSVPKSYKDPYLLPIKCYGQSFLITYAQTLFAT